ncbi:hypothetical protein F2Q70_00015911 [Brassica cretica]|uniref:Uncharacterized protein n=1 Tax=Brassica cretica TaxID=69181 RepID=A0A8S9HQG2_BRACR|nr:hypothetical protein F2Q70_00015911 [Brassica cretica]
MMGSRKTARTSVWMDFQITKHRGSKDEPAVREAGSGPPKLYQSDYGSRTEFEGLFKICLDRTDVENAKREHWRTDERLDLGSDQVGLTLCMIIWRMIGLLKLFWITRESYPINFSKCWKQPRGLFKSMDPDHEVKKRERLTKCILKLKDNKLTGVRIESSGSREPRMLRKSLRRLHRKGSRQDSRVDELDVVNGN